MRFGYYRENKALKEFRGIKDPLVLSAYLENEVCQGQLVIKEEEEIQEDQGPKGHLVNKVNEGCKESVGLLDLLVSRVMQVILDLLVPQENQEQPE